MKKSMMKHFTVLYKKQTMLEQKSPDMRYIDHTLHTMVVDAKSLASAQKMLSKMERTKVVRITENGAPAKPVFKMATKKQFFSQTYSL